MVRSHELGSIMIGYGRPDTKGNNNASSSTDFGGGAPTHSTTERHVSRSRTPPAPQPLSLPNQTTNQTLKPAQPSNQPSNQATNQIPSSDRTATGQLPPSYRQTTANCDPATSQLPPSCRPGKVAAPQPPPGYIPSCRLVGPSTSTPSPACCSQRLATSHIGGGAPNDHPCSHYQWHALIARLANSSIAAMGNWQSHNTKQQYCKTYRRVRKHAALQTTRLGGFCLAGFGIRRDLSTGNEHWHQRVRPTSGLFYRHGDAQ